MKNEIRMNVMAQIKNVTDTALLMFNNQCGKIISVGKTESYVRFWLNNKVYVEFIPNNNLKPFRSVSV